MTRQPADRLRFWPMLLAGATFALALLILASTDFSRRGIEHVLRLVATSRVSDWATHVAEKHNGFLRDFGRRPLSDEEMADLRREAKIYGIEAFRFSLAHDPLGKVRIYASNTFEPRHREIALAAFGESTLNTHETGVVRIRVPLVGERKRILGFVTAVVDQKYLLRELTVAAQHVLFSAVAALFIILLVSAFLFRRMRSDAMHHITHAREYDELTGLPNQTAFEQALTGLLHESGEPGRKDTRPRSYGCLIFGIDDLGHITCSEGHEAASHVLRTLGARFARLAHENDARIFRLERDDFAILMPASNAGDKVVALAHKLLKEARRPLYWHGKALLFTLSMGMALYPQQATSPSELARRATLMRQAARDSGGNALRLYDRQMDTEYNEMARLERLVRKAARNCANYFSLHYQPIVRLEDERLHGFEVLLRMDDDEGNPVSPAVFIPIAERLNLMDDIGAFVLAEACTTAANWPTHLKVSVNLSPLQFRSGRLVATVWKALETSGLAPEQLELEVTESIMMQDWDQVRAQLDSIRQRGVKIVLDDFGTGYSSMSYLWKFNFDKLKIDRSFTQAIGSCNEARSILRSLIIMARSLKLPVVVEGIERMEEALFLRKFRCDFGQGYYFGKPMPTADVATVIMKDWERRKLHKETTFDTIDIARQSAAL